MVDKTKILQDARKLLAKGQTAKAIEEYLKLAKAHPDGNIFNTIGDLYLKKGDIKSAIKEYHNAAKYYTEEGFSLKALAIHKKVLNLNPKDAPALVALGELNEEKNIVTDAIKYYLAAADVLSKENKKTELLEVFDRILNLAPNNIKLRVKVSDLFSKEGFVPEAAQEYCNIGKLFSDRNDMANARVYLTKAIEIQPSNKDVLIALSDLAEKEGNLEEAADHIQSAIEKAGESSELLLKQSHLNIRTGKIEEALTSLTKLLELEPDNYNIRKELGDLYQKTGDIMAAWDEYKQVIDPLMQDGKNLEAISIIETFKEFDAIDNSLKLIELYKAEAEEDKTFNELFELHIAYTEQAKIVEALEVLKQARDIKPDDAEVNQAIGEIERMLNPPEPDREAADHVEAPSDEAVPETQEAPPAEAQEAATTTQSPASNALNEADVFIQYGLFSDAKNLLEAEKLKNPSSLDIHQKLRKVYKELGETEQAVTECIVLSALYKSTGDEVQSQAMLMEAFALSPHDPRLEGKVDAWTPAPPEPEPAPTPGVAAVNPQDSIDDMFGGNEEELNEADFHMQQGFYNDAADIYRKLLVQSPADAGIKQKLQEAESQIAAAVPPPKPIQEEVVPFAGESGEELFDFSSILESDEAAEPAVDALDSDVQDIFNEFKKGLSAEVEAEDSATHYDLGIAYKEMGLLDDAIKEFQTSQRDPSYYSQSMTMIGLCYMVKGTFVLAVDAFSAALMKTGANDDARWSLKYDLGEAYELDGKTTEALQMYKEVIKWDPNFREIVKKIHTLGGGAPEPAAKATPEPQPKTEPAAKLDEKPKNKKNRVSYI